VFRLWYAAENEINQSPLPKVALEMCLLEMIHAQQSIPVEEVLQKLDALQQKITGAPGAQSPVWGAPAKNTAPAGTYEPVKNHAGSGCTAPVEEAKRPTPVVPEVTAGKRDTAEFLAFVRQRNLPLASQLEHGTLRLQDDRELLIELPADSFFLESINDRETGNKIKGLCEEFFNKQLKVTVVPVKKVQQHAGSQPKELDRKKKVHDAMHNPLIQKIVETFEGEIVEVKTDI